MKPMLASPAGEISFPCFVSPKMDGVRAFVKDGILLSRSMKPIRNRHVQGLLGKAVLDGLDGELCVGNPWDKNLMQQTTSGVMSIEGEPEFCWYVFDAWGMGGPAYRRFATLNPKHSLPNYVRNLMNDDALAFVEQPVVNNEEELLAYEAKMLALGYEGVIVRKYDGEYKFGRSTAREQGMLKLKRFVSAEAVVTGYEELQRNHNEAFINELGHTARSSHQANKIGGSTLGVLIGRDIKTGDEIRAGTGLDNAMRDEIWTNRHEYINRLFTYKHFPHGVKDKVRHPVFVSFRSPDDM